jgi:predicted transcriptional regulator
MKPTKKTFSKNNYKLVSSLVDFAGNSNTLTDFERAILEQSLRDVEAGNVIPHDVAMKQAAQWLKESSK